MKNLLSLIFGKKRTNDKELFALLRQRAYLRNGVGLGFISSPELYFNGHIELGIGMIRSGYGDWGGGAEYCLDSPLKIVLDKDFIIQKVSTHSFYNSKDSQEKQAIADKFLKRLPVGSRFIITNDLLIDHLSTIFSLLPCKVHIGYDVFGQSHMLKFIQEAAETKTGTFYQRGIIDSFYKNNSNESQ